MLLFPNVDNKPKAARLQIGEMAGPTLALPAAVLRSSGLELSGIGGGSMPRAVILESLPQIWALAALGKLHIDCERVALADVEQAWQQRETHGRRIVVIP